MLFCLTALGRAIDPPSWGGTPQYQVNVSMTDHTTRVGAWNFSYYYDALLKAQLYEHRAPQEDEMCQLATPGANWTKLDCIILFSSDGWSYIKYPQANFCCKCEDKFGFIKPDWLSRNSTFVGLQNVSGVQTQHWTEQGQYLNNYYCSNDANRLPVRFSEYKFTKLKAWDFNLSTFRIGKVPEEKFAPLCSNLCTGTCERLRTQMN